MAEMKRVIQVLRDILSDLAKLDDEQLQHLLDKTAKFKYFDASEVAKTKTKKNKATIDEPTMNTWKEQLFACKSKDEALQYVKGLKLTNEGLKAFAAFLHCGLFGAGKKEQMVAAIVNGTVMSKLNAEAIHRI